MERSNVRKEGSEVLLGLPSHRSLTSDRPFVVSGKSGLRLFENQHGLVDSFETSPSESVEQAKRNRAPETILHLLG